MKKRAGRRRINLHREQERAYGKGVHIDIDSHNVHANPRASKKRKHQRAPVALKAARRVRKQYMFAVQHENPYGKWEPQGFFSSEQAALDYAHALKLAHPTQVFRVWRG